MKTVPQGLRDLFDEMLEENKDAIKSEMKETLLATIHGVPSYISEAIQSFGAIDEEE